MSQQVIKKMVTLSESIIPICDPLKALGIHTFTLLINYHNGIQINLSNKPMWVNDYYQLNLYNSSLYDNDPCLFNSGYNLWSGASHLPVFQYGLQRFDSGQGITIIRSQHDYTAFYFFSGSNKNTQLLNFIINNLSFLENFIQYFSQQANNVLVEGYSLNLNRIINNDKQVDIKNINKSLKQYQHLCKLKQDIETKMRMELSLPNDSLISEISLTPRQKQILYWSFQGKSAKQIAKILGVSPRTVERHFEILREKIGATNKQELTFKALMKNQTVIG